MNLIPWPYRWLAVAAAAALAGLAVAGGAVLIAGASAPKLVTRAMLKSMKRGAVIVDVAIDQGGCFETSHPTTHADPTFEVDGVIHYCVANMPGAVPITSTYALTNATMPYVVKLADRDDRMELLAFPRGRVHAFVHGEADEVVHEHEHRRRHAGVDHAVPRSVAGKADRDAPAVECAGEHRLALVRVELRADPRVDRCRRGI